MLRIIINSFANLFLNGASKVFSPGHKWRSRSLGHDHPTERHHKNCLKSASSFGRNQVGLHYAKDSHRSLSILVVCQYFFPENFGINAVAAELASRGHEVTILTGMPNYPSGIIADGYGGRMLRRETYKNVAVIRVPIIARGRNSKMRLALNYMSYALNASILAPFVVKSRPDVILVYQLSPVMIALPAIVMKLFTGSKILLWVQDIWPDSLVATGAVTNRLVLGVIQKMVRLIYRFSSIIAVQSNQFVDFIRPLIPRTTNSIRYLPNAADGTYRPVEVPLEAPERKLFRPGFNIVFAGNLGLAQNLEIIMAAIVHLKGRTDIQWVFIGDGRRRSWLEGEIQQHGITDTVQVLGPFSPERMPTFFAIADALLITLSNEKIFSLTIPSKLQTYLACARPVLGAVSGEAANIITVAGAGLVVSPNDHESLAKMALTMAQMPREQLDTMGKSGFEYHQHEFSNERTLDLLEGWLRELSSPASISS